MKSSASRWIDLRSVALGAVDPPSLEPSGAHEGYDLEAMSALVRWSVPGARRFVGKAEQVGTGDDLIELAEIVEQQLGGRPCGELRAYSQDRSPRTGGRRS